jgi:hypothetical protein
VTTFAYSIPNWGCAGILMLGFLLIIIEFANLCASAAERRKKQP